VYTRTFLEVGDGTAGLSGRWRVAARRARPAAGGDQRPLSRRQFGFFNNTDLEAYAGLHEVFPFLNWLVVETDTTRFKSAGTHVIYDAGGHRRRLRWRRCERRHDGWRTASEQNSLRRRAGTGRALLRARTCPAGDSVAGTTGLLNGSCRSARQHQTEGWQGCSGQNSFIEFAMSPLPQERTAASKARHLRLDATL